LIYLVAGGIQSEINADHLYRGSEYFYNSYVKVYTAFDSRRNMVFPLTFKLLWISFIRQKKSIDRSVRIGIAIKVTFQMAEIVFMIKKYRYILTQKIQTLLCWIVRLYSCTFRLTVENENVWLDHLEAGGRVLLCAWHQQFFAAIRHFKAYEHFRPSLMISQSQDGDVIARIARQQGWHPVRGSSSRDGGKALKEIITRLQQSRLAGHIVDGPRGPAGVIKAGVISIARATDAVIVPFYTLADRAWYFKSWDNFMLPKPFARVALRFGTMISCSENVVEKCFEAQRAELEAIMRPALISPVA
jgi:lysophospholipid acyltransferase (LPLAT)-like uncharacterized protein